MRLRVEITHDTGVVRGQEPVATVLQMTGAELPTMARQLRALADSLEPPQRWVTGLEQAGLHVPTREETQR